MIRFALKKIRRFAWKEAGSATIEFVMLIPLFFWLTYTGVEVGFLAINHSHLERALDETIRDVRLNRLPPDASRWTHTVVKDMVCDRARFIDNCEANLAIEMTKVDPRRGNPFDADFREEGSEDEEENALANIFCVDTPQEVRPKQVFNPGIPDDLMIVRACVEVSIPWLAAGIMSQRALRDSDGQYELHATTVFVNEPT